MEREKYEESLSDRQAVRCAVCFKKDDNHNTPQVNWFECTHGGRNSSVGSAWARCPQCHGFDPPHFPVEGIFPLELTWIQTPFPQKLLRMRV